MTSFAKDAKAMGKPMSPHVAAWLGTFVAAGIQLAVHAKGDSKSSKTDQKQLEQGIRMALLGPAVGLALWKLFSMKQKASPVLPIVTASLIGTSLLKTELEAEAVNSVIWLRVASGVLSGSSRPALSILTHVAIMVTFYGVINHTSIAPGILVKMTRRFLTPPVFEAVKDKEKEKPTLKDSLVVFGRTFRGLFAYNYFLHFAAALVSFAIRSFGSKAVKGARPIRTGVVDVLRQAAKEATVLNTAVSASCALLVAGTSLGSNNLGVLAMPLPLWFCAPRVRDTVYFLFAPWCVKYLFRLHDVGNALNARLRLLLGVYLLEGPLRSFSENSESYSWMIGVAFGLVKTAGSGLI